MLNQYNFHNINRTCFFRNVVAPRIAVVLLHPTASNGEAMAIQGRWTEYNDIAICAPNSPGRDPHQPPHPYKNPSFWSSGEEPVVDREVNDVAFIDNMIDEITNTLPQGCPLYLVGHSNGCAMGFRVLSEGRNKHKFTAAALYAAEWSKPVGALDLPLSYLSSQMDKIRPFDGNAKIVTPWFELTSTPVFDTVEHCLRARKSSGKLTGMRVYEHQTTLCFNDGTAPLEFTLLHNQGHNWPAGVEVNTPPSLSAIVGPDNAELNATELVLSFFKRHTPVVNSLNETRSEIWQPRDPANHRTVEASYEPSVNTTSTSANR